MIYQLATLSERITSAGREFRILPAGVFRAKDGRPANLPGWKIDAEIAQRVIAASASADEIVVDYEHQTINAQTNGQPAPAAGWFSRMVWREGLGLFAVDVKWTDKARAMIAAGEYRHISPVFPYSAVTGEVQKIVSLALTNNPALPGLTDLAALTAKYVMPLAEKASSRAVEVFNRNFGEAGVFHPDTPGEELARLTGNVPAPSIPASMEKNDPQGAATLRAIFPEVFK
jgi:phage I-like protein